LHSIARNHARTHVHHGAIAVARTQPRTRVTRRARTHLEAGDDAAPARQRRCSRDAIAPDARDHPSAIRPRWPMDLGPTRREDHPRAASVDRIGHRR
jgi:hypothetical protein